MEQKEERKDYKIGQGMSGDIPFFACFFSNFFGNMLLKKQGGKYIIRKYGLT